MVLQIVYKLQRFFFEGLSKVKCDQGKDWMEVLQFG